MTHHMTEET